MKLFRFFYIIFFCGILLNACRQIDLYEQHSIIPDGKWYADKPVTGSFEIDDTTSAYNISLVIRHRDNYQYNNIWLNVGSQAPGDTMKFQRVEFTLGSDALGWEGTGMSDIWEVRKPLNVLPENFREKGIYTYSISQDMRNNPLEHILNVGLRVEKAP